MVVTCVVLPIIALGIAATYDISIAETILNSQLYHSVKYRHRKASHRWITYIERIKLGIWLHGSAAINFTYDGHAL
jgi:hypothetical protein